jgi:hypothetical protein
VLCRAAAGLAFTILAACPARPASCAEDSLDESPFTRLFDTGSSSPEPLSAQAVAAKAGWSLVPEDNLTHTFKGDAVLANDKLAVVLRAQGTGAEVYSHTPAGPRLRASVAPLGAPAAGAFKPASLRIVQNGGGAVALEGRFQAAGASASLEFRLATAQIALELRPSEGIEKVQVQSRTLYVVVPEFFGDDVALGPQAPGRLGVPAENFCVSLLEGHDAMLMCVWQAGGRPVEALFAGGPKPIVEACEIGCLKGKIVWIALLEQAGLWHEQVLSAEAVAKGVVLDWRPPFPAKWRADFVRPDGAAQSWFFADAKEPEGEPPAVKQRDCPCWLDAGRAIVQVERPGGSSPLAAGRPSPVLVYPIDRSRATPLATFCPVDVLRNTLGVGPCQYILQTEGLASETNATPDEVMNWVEKQLGRKKSRGAADEFRERLNEMVGQVARTQARIDQYAQGARELRALLDSQSQSQGGRERVQALLPLVERLEAVLAAGPTGATPAKQAARLADEIVAVVGKENGLAEARRLGSGIRLLGAEQDRTLANCRMAMRWLRVQAATVGAAGAPGADLAAKVRAKVDQVLQTK